MIFRLNPEKANEGRGCVVPPFVISVDAGIQGNDSLFVGVFKVSKNGISTAGSKAFARMTAGGCVAGWDKLSRTVVPPLSSPSKLDPRVQGDDSLFLQCVNVNKSGTRLLNAHIRKDDGGANLKHTPI